MFEKNIVSASRRLRVDGRLVRHPGHLQRRVPGHVRELPETAAQTGPQPAEHLHARQDSEPRGPGLRRLRRPAEETDFSEASDPATAAETSRGSNPGR